MTRKQKTTATAIAAGAVFAALFGGMFTAIANPFAWPPLVQVLSIIAAVITSLGIIAEAELNEKKQKHPMTPEEFTLLVAKMRNAQKDYFKNRHMAALELSRELEKQVDKYLKENAPTLPKKPETLNLF